jgi:hypothetical protein
MPGGNAQKIVNFGGHEMLTNLSQLMGGVLLRIEHRKGCRDSGWGEMFVKNPRFEYSLVRLNQSIKLFLAMS